MSEFSRFLSEELQDLLEEEDFQPRVKRPPLQTHCDVPLKYNKARAAIRKPALYQHCPPNNRYHKEWILIQQELGACIPDYFDMCHFQYFFLNQWTPSAKDLPKQEFHQQWRVSEEVWNIQKDALGSSYTPNQQFKSFNLSDSDLESLERMYMKKSLCEEMVLSSGSENYKPLAWITKKDGISFYKDFKLRMAVTENLFFIRANSMNFLCSRDHFLCLSDLVSQRYILTKYLMLDKNSGHPQISVGEVTQFFELGDKILHKGGNASYKLIYSMEPLILSFLVGDIKIGRQRDKTFQDLILQDCFKLAEIFNVTETFNEMLTLLKIVNQRDQRLLIELYGLYRIWGHPTIEPLEGSLELKRIATSVRFSNNDLIEEVTNKFKEEFICRYKSREHRWPELDVTSLPPSNVIRVAYERKTLFPRKHRLYRRSDLTLVNFKQVFPIDPKFDLVELIADKALSLHINDLIVQITSFNHCGTSIDRSVLLNWLKSPIQDPEAFLKHIDIHGFPSWEIVMGVREKEREGKLLARLFGLMTLYKRMYIVLTEALLAEHILPYFPEITMIDDELSLDKKRYQFTSGEKTDAIMMSLDFSKWNSNMRKNETKPMFRCFDHLFGLSNCFQRTHEMFENAQLYLLNGTYLPILESVDGKTRLKENQGCWSGHLGGIEGLRQKGWTLWTVCLILLASENLSFRLQMMGQGDNQILRLLFPEGYSQEESEITTYQFLDKLDEILSQIGPQLKLEETWVSRDLFVYGKYIVYKGTPCSMVLKRISRCLKLGNEDYPTLESALSSLAANLNSAVASSYAIGPLLKLYLGEVVGALQLAFRSQYLQDDPMWSVLSKPFSILISGTARETVSCLALLGNDQIQKDMIYKRVCLLPRPLGGFPIVNIFDCMLRGFPDEVSFSIASLSKFFEHAGFDLKPSLAAYMSPPLNPECSYKLLFEHPTCLNLEIPPAPSESRRNLIIEFLKEDSIHLNAYVRSFLSRLQSPEENDLYVALETMNPFNPRLASMIVSSTVEARARQVAGKLQKTKTIAAVAREIGNKDLYSKITHAELNHTASVLRLASRVSQGPVAWASGKCSVDHADELRNVGWRKKIVGVNCVPPHEFMVLETVCSVGKCDDNTDLSKGHMVIRLDPLALARENFNPSITGSYSPYRGSTTKQKVTGYGSKISVQAEPLLQRVLRLYSLVGWGITRDGNLHKLLNLILSSSTDLDPGFLAPCEEEITGSVHHRLQDLRTGHGGAVPVLPNYGQKFMFDTFPLIAYSKGSKNVNLMFQSFMSMSTVLLGEILHQNWITSQPTLHMHVKSACCVQEITDEKCEISTLDPFQGLKIERDNPYLFVPAANITFLIDKGLRFDAYPQSVNDRTLLLHRYHSILAEEILHQIGPHSWDYQIYTKPVNILMINWTLKTHLGLLIVHLSLRLMAHYLGAVRETELHRFILRIAERIRRSPIERWAGLGALVFCEGFHHHVVSPLIGGRVSGNPICSEVSLGGMIKDSVVDFLLKLDQDKMAIKLVSGLEFGSRTFCGLSQHPSFLCLMQRWIMGDIRGEHILEIRYGMMSSLENSRCERLSPELETWRKFLIDKGKTRISGESLDFLCKLDSLQIPKVKGHSHECLTLKPGGQALCEVNDKNVIQTKYTVFEDAPHQKETSYVLHTLKLVAHPTSGSYKCLSILEFICRIYPERRLTSILCLGDGGGGFTCACLLKFPTAEVYFNTLVGSGVGIQQSSPIPFLPALAGFPQLEARLKNLDFTNDFISDFTNPLYPVLFSNRMSDKINMIMSDAEISGPDRLSDGIKLVDGFMDIAYALNAKVAVMKVYLDNVSLFGYQASRFLHLYERVHLFRSGFSSLFNYEIYLIGIDERKIEKFKVRSQFVFEGPFLNHSTLSMLYKMRDVLMEGFSPRIDHIIQSYSRALKSDYILDLTRDVKRILPFYREDMIINFPNDVHKWIQDTSSKKVGLPRIQRVKAETTTLHISYLRNWVLAFLVSAGISDPLDFIPRIPLLISKGTLIWFRLIGGNWSVLIMDHCPEWGVSRAYRTFKINEIISGGDEKILHRLIGAGLFLNIKISGSSRGLHRFTDPTMVQRIIHQHKTGIPECPQIAELLLKAPHTAHIRSNVHDWSVLQDKIRIIRRRQNNN